MPSYSIRSVKASGALSEMIYLQKVALVGGVWRPVTGAQADSMLVNSSNLTVIRASGDPAAWTVDINVGGKPMLELDVPTEIMTQFLSSEGVLSSIL